MSEGDGAPRAAAEPPPHGAALLESCMLHVTNGDATAEPLRAAGLPGTVIAWADVLHEGPVLVRLSPTAFREMRARFLVDQSTASFGEFLVRFAARDHALDRAGDHDEVVLWFEHDLYDQLQIVQILDRIAGLPTPPARLTMICVDAVPGVEPFHGLGQLTAGQLAALFPSRRPVTPAQTALAIDAWAAVRATDPTRLAALAAGSSSPLPFLPAALIRFLEQLPATRDGLSRSERQVLEAVAAGASDPVAVFRADQAREAAPFMGDTSLWYHLYGLAAGPAPLLAMAGGGALRPPAAPGFVAQPLAVTDAGRRVLDGAADRVALGGVGRWLGGVWLASPRAAWRWDGQRPVSVPGA